MKQIIHFEPLTPAKFQIYITIGTKAYNQHYLHLWPNEDSSPYIKNSFTLEILEEEEKNENTRLFLINLNSECIGILKFTVSKELGSISENEALYVDKIYIVNEACGFGIGTKTIMFIMLWAQESQKSIVWLDTMQKGPALCFYQKNGFTIHSKTELPLKQAIKKEKPMFIMTREVS